MSEVLTSAVLVTVQTIRASIETRKLPLEGSLVLSYKIRDDLLDLDPVARRRPPMWRL